MTRSCVSRLIHTCVMSHSYVCHDSFIRASWLTGAQLHGDCDTHQRHTWMISFTYVSLLIYTCVMTHKSSTVWVMHLAYMCDMTHPCVSWLVLMCHDSQDLHCMYDMIRSCVWWLIHMCDMTHSYVCHDSFIWLIHMCVVTHSYVCHDSFICASWLTGAQLHGVWGLWVRVFSRGAEVQCVALCCIVLQCAAVCCRCVAVCYSVLQCVATCYSVLQRVAVCCSMFQWVALCCSSVLQCVCSVLQLENIYQPTCHCYECQGYERRGVSQISPKSARYSIFHLQELSNFENFFFLKLARTCAHTSSPRLWVKRRFLKLKQWHVNHSTMALRYCNPLQHAATHCNTLQHTATCCNTVQHIFESHVAHTNESCPWCIWVMVHIYMRHVSHVNASCPTCDLTLFRR